MTKLELIPLSIIFGIPMIVNWWPVIERILR